MHVESALGERSLLISAIVYDVYISIQRLISAAAKSMSFNKLEKINCVRSTWSMITEAWRFVTLSGHWFLGFTAVTEGTWDLRNVVEDEVSIDPCRSINLLATSTINDDDLDLSKRFADSSARRRRVRHVSTGRDDDKICYPNTPGT